MIRRASALLLLLAPTLASAQTDDALVLAPPAPPDVVDERPRAAALERARALDGQTDYAGAATAYEAYARGCLSSTTAVLAEAHPCGGAADALERAFELRRALGQADHADADAREYLGHLLYARPRAAIRIGYARARMHLAAGEPDRAEDALDELTELLPDPPVGQLIVSDALRARIEAARGRDRHAQRHWRQVERRFEREHAEIDPDGAVPAAWILEAVAEGRLLRAELAVERFLATRAPSSARVGDPERWWSATMSPWLVRTRRRLLLARMELERVYELGSPRHSVIAAARIGELYGHQADLHAALELPRSEWIQALVHEGRARPGYDEARTHLETCVSWAAHHGVARDWSRRCEEGLHRLDPYRYPVPAELHGAAAYLPSAHAIPGHPPARR